jgi:hypothetical protein
LERSWPCGQKRRPRPVYHRKRLRRGRGSGAKANGVPLRGQRIEGAGWGCAPCPSGKCSGGPLGRRSARQMFRPDEHSPAVADLGCIVGALVRHIVSDACASAVPGIWRLRADAKLLTSFASREYDRRPGRAGNTRASPGPHLTQSFQGEDEQHVGFARGAVRRMEREQSAACASRCHRRQRARPKATRGT